VRVLVQGIGWWQGDRKGLTLVGLTALAAAETMCMLYRVNARTKCATDAQHDDGGCVELGLTLNRRSTGEKRRSQL